MRSTLLKIVEQLVNRCPKSGRITGLRRDTGLAQILFPVLGVLALGWFLFRVVPKPSRAAYPCQRVAAGIGAGFLAYLVGLLLAYTGFRFVYQRLGKMLALVAVVAVVALGYYGMGRAQTRTPGQPIVQDLTPREGCNNPMGDGKGISPGRVVWVQDFRATPWDGKAGNWWQDENIDQLTVDRMFSRSLQSLTGTSSDAEAWDRLSHFYNKTNSRGERGYQKGEKIVIKLNLNADAKGTAWSNAGYPTPHAVYTMVRQLIEVAGVPGACVTLADPSRCLNQILYAKIRSHPGPDFQQVTFADKLGGEAPQRVKAEPDMKSPIHFTLPGNSKVVMYLPKIYTEATYLINYALVRPHRVFGITMAAKNHFGSVYDIQAKAFAPNVLHAFALWDYATPYQHGNVNGLVQLLGHRELGGKTLLYFGDGLYTSKNQSLSVVRWSTLNNRWFSSFLMSQDPVALDSVGYDLLCSEPNLTQGNPSFNGHVDGYLHEAALAGHPPSKARYDPEDDGTALQSLGVHEHWNNAAEKKYSRNLGKKEGVELIAISMD
ncbi:MAG: DUF362 domain-containing protein [Planctomycetes bacterium]|nr:DUF362 domain-containing protein [Planctomycetota bacterium]